MALLSFLALLSFSGASDLVAPVALGTLLVAAIGGLITLVTKLIDLANSKEERTFDAFNKLVDQLQERVQELGEHIRLQTQTEDMLRREVLRLRQRVDALARVLVSNGIPVPPEESE